MDTLIITAEQFEAATGSKPQQDDLERCNCKEAGKLMHRQCGWCTTCNRPNFMHSLTCFKVGDIVEPVPGSGTFLRSGASQYLCAVVISSKPLMLVSLETDMLWTATVNDMSLQVCGKATPEQLALCMKRMPL